MLLFGVKDIHPLTLNIPLGAKPRYAELSIRDAKFNDILIVNKHALTIWPLLNDYN